jgi:hypothetical protein
MQRRAGSAAEVEKIILKRQEEMEHSSLTVKEEKAALQEMKRMKNDAQVPLAHAARAAAPPPTHVGSALLALRVRAARALHQLRQRPAARSARGARSLASPHALPCAPRGTQRYFEWEQELDVLKHKRAVCTEQLRLAYEQLDEQRSLAFRLESAATLHVGLDELVESRLAVGEEMQELLSSLQWKKKLSSECSVVMKMDRGPRRGVIVAGTAPSVEAAKALIESIGPVAVLKKALDEEQQKLLLGKRGATIAQLQEETGCSLEIKRTTGTLIIAGPEPQVQSTEELIDELLRDQVAARCCARDAGGAPRARARVRVRVARDAGGAPRARARVCACVWPLAPVACKRLVCARREAMDGSL